MRLDASLGASHHGGRFGNIQFFPVTQEEGLALTQRQLPDFAFNEGKELRLLEVGLRFGETAGVRIDRQSVERIGVLFATTES